ncbi:hypothetical protein EGW08_023468 [Elysia chlorotica]|uniref:Reverse transcriptase domain-containing protein n=1 Tax=Elysia chlorotica TaxID=188477 RepID=A0A433SIK2_ELYCH|nr:hypothetical protein EGW08_023468 [Elysia chlorotica]
MSAAFDTIDRDILLQILKDIVEEDELSLIQFLLSNTHINTRINNADINAPFTSNVGTPQGDGLSPVLFIIYLEHALKEVRKVIGEPKSPLEEKIPREIAYADDVDFVGLEYIDIDAVQRTLHKIYNLKVNLKVNIAKTEKTLLSKNEDAWRSTKKVGSLMGDKEDRRVHGDVDFGRTWKEYKDGFGDINGDFWLGNEAVYKLTNQLLANARSGTTDLLRRQAMFYPRATAPPSLSATLQQPLDL